MDSPDMNLSTDETPLTHATRRQYINHIRRLREQNRILAEMLAQERKARRGAYAWYQKRLSSWWWTIIDTMVMQHREHKPSRPSNILQKLSGLPR